MGLRILSFIFCSGFVFHLVPLELEANCSDLFGLLKSRESRAENQDQAIENLREGLSSILGFHNSGFTKLAQTWSQGMKSAEEADSHILKLGMLQKAYQSVTQSIGQLNKLTIKDPRLAKALLTTLLGRVFFSDSMTYTLRALRRAKLISPDNIENLDSISLKLFSKLTKPINQNLDPDEKRLLDSFKNIFDPKINPNGIQTTAVKALDHKILEGRETKVFRMWSASRTERKRNLRRLIKTWGRIDLSEPYSSQGPQ